MTNDVIIPKGSRVIMKLATIFDPKDTRVVYNYEVSQLKLLDPKFVGAGFGDQKLVARAKIYQFFVEVLEPIVGSGVFYGIRPIKPVVVKYVGERPEDKTGHDRWATIEFYGGAQKTVPYNSLNMNKPRLIPVHFEHYLHCWAAYPTRNRGESFPKYLVGSYYTVKEIDGILYATDPEFPKVKSEEELLMEMDPVNKERLLEQYKKERDRIDAKIEILERKNS